MSNNPAAPSPSDSSIAQAFRDYQAKWPGDADTGMAGWIERRAREIDASAPAAAVGGDWMMRLAKEIKANAEDHPGDYIAKFALTWADELAARAVSTPAAPVGGFVLVPREPTEKMVIDGFESEPDAFFSTPEEWDAYEAMTGCQRAAHRARLCWAAMIAAAPAAQPSAKDGVME